MNTHRAKMQTALDELASPRGKPLDMSKEHKEFVESWKGYPDKLPPAERYFARLEDQPLPAWITRSRT